MNSFNTTNSEVSFGHDAEIKNLKLIPNIGNPVYTPLPPTWSAYTPIIPLEPSCPYLLQQLRQLGGIPFQDYLGGFFTYLRYRVEKTKPTGDMGADLIIKGGFDKIVIQAKQEKENIGVSAIQEVFAAKTYYDATHARVIITSKFTKSALKLAKKLGVECWDAERLLQELYTYRYFYSPL